REVVAPSSVRARIDANLDAIEVIQRLDAAGRNATGDEQETLARWSGWGGCWQVFDASKEAHAGQRERLYSLLDADEVAAARRSTLNAHYTDPAVAGAMWDALQTAG